MSPTSSLPSSTTIEFSTKIVESCIVKDGLELVQTKDMDVILIFKRKRLLFPFVRTLRHRIRKTPSQPRRRKRPRCSLTIHVTHSSTSAAVVTEGHLNCMIFSYHKSRCRTPNTSTWPKVQNGGRF